MIHTEFTSESNDKIVLAGRIFYAVGLFGIGVQHFIFGNFIPVMVPLQPDWIMGRLIFAYLLGAILIAFGSLMIFGNWKRTTAMISGMLFLLFVLFIHIPQHIINHSYSIGSWTIAFKEFAFFGCSFVVAGSFTVSQNAENKSSLIERFGNKIIPYSKYPLAIMVFVFGIDHFVYTGFVSSLVPAWIPGHIFWTYFAGAALVSAGIGLIFNIKQRLAGTMLGVMLFILGYNTAYS